MIIKSMVCIAGYMGLVLNCAVSQANEDASKQNPATVRTVPSRFRIDLAGSWGFYPDVGDRVPTEVTKAGPPPGAIMVPGAWQAQGYGPPGGAMPSPLRQGAVVWGLKLTAWISPVKDLNKAVHWTEVVTDNRLHLVLCNLDLLSDKPESRYVLARTLDYMLTSRPCSRAARISDSQLDTLLH